MMKLSKRAALAKRNYYNHRMDHMMDLVRSEFPMLHTKLEVKALAEALLTRSRGRQPKVGLV